MEMGIYNNSNAFFNHWSSNALFKTEIFQSEDGHCIIHRIASKKNCGIEIWEDGKMPSKSPRCDLSALFLMQIWASGSKAVVQPWVK